MNKIYLVIAEFEDSAFQVKNATVSYRKAKEYVDKACNDEEDAAITIKELEIENIVLKDTLIETIDLDLGFMDTAVKRNVYPISSNHKIQIDAEIALLKRYRKIIEEMA